MQVKQEAPELLQEEEEVICIKEEPKEDQEVTASLLPDCHVQQGPFPVSEVRLQLKGQICPQQVSFPGK